MLSAFELTVATTPQCGDRVVMSAAIAPCTSPDNSAVDIAETVAVAARLKGATRPVAPVHSNDGKWRHRGRGQDHSDVDFSRHGGGWCNGSNQISESYANHRVFREARGKMRDAWSRHLKRLAAEGNDEEWPTFDEIAELVRDTPYSFPARSATDDVEDEKEDAGGQPVFWWSSDFFAAGGGGDTLRSAHAPRTAVGLLRWRHGGDAVAEVFGEVAEDK